MARKELGLRVWSRPLFLQNTLTFQRFAFGKSSSDKFLLAVFFLSAFLLWLSWIAGSKGLEGLKNLPFASLIGYCSIFVVLGRIEASTFLTSRDIFLIGGSSVLFAIPQNTIIAFVFTTIGFLLISKNDRNIVSLGQICIGLAWIDVWGPFLLVTIEDWLLRFEALIAFMPLKLFGEYKLVGTAIYGNSDHSVIIYAPCSAFNNTVRSAFIWLCLIKLCDFRPAVWQIYGLIASLFGIIVLNCGRIGLMATSFERYDYWHNGFGSSLYGYSMTFLVFSIFYFLAVKHQSDRR